MAFRRLQVLFAVISLVFLPRVENCAYELRHPQTIFCQSQFVIRADVLSVEDHWPTDTDDDIYRRYNIRVNEVFKGQEHLLNTVTPQLYTAMDSCRASLSPDTEYLIMGYMENDRLTTQGYFQNREWKRVTLDQVKGLNTVYSTTCDSNCEPARVRPMNGDVHDESMRDICSLLDDKYCYIDHSYCTRNEYGACEWEMSLNLLKCIEGE